ncbi:MAG: biotin synthase BioB [Christensenellaceae bacterium]|nr:biotin synthase BioB [Christensenellaceae bacterium]
MQNIQHSIYQGHQISKEEALLLSIAPLDELCTAANQLREHFCGNVFDMCSIINGKSGGCTENCKFCAQSKHYNTCVPTLDMPSTDIIVNAAKHNYSKGVLRFSIVTAGRALTDNEVDDVCVRYRHVGENCDIYKCASHGLLTKHQLEKIKEAGVKRYHNNLETSRNFFPNMCTTHTYDDKINTIKAAQEVGLEVCSGGIIGIGETMEDRIDMMFDLRDLGVKSIPVNIINPIPGTPYMHITPLDEETIMRVVAVYRFIIPDSMIRIAGGRGLLSDKGAKLFESGANAVATGDMLTTSGISIDHDMEIVKNAGFNVVLR